MTARPIKAVRIRDASGGVCDSAIVVTAEDLAVIDAGDSEG